MTIWEWLSPVFVLLAFGFVAWNVCSVWVVIRWHMLKFIARHNKGAKITAYSFGSIEVRFADEDETRSLYDAFMRARGLYHRSKYNLPAVDAVPDPSSKSLGAWQQ